MVITIGNIHGAAKTFSLAVISVHKIFFAIYILQYHRAMCDSGFGLFALKAGRLAECRNHLGIKVKLLWWEWSWVRNE